MRPLVPRALSLAFALAPTSLAVAACNPWQEASQTDMLVFADDDSELAIQELRFEERQGDALSGSTEKRDFRQQLFRADPKGERHLPIGPERTGQHGGDLYFMKTAGYLVASSVPEEGGLVGWDRISLDDGTSQSIPMLDESYDWAFAIPSPDASLIAVVSGAGQSVRAQLFDEATLEPASERDDVTVAGTPEWTFRPDGAFVVTDATSAWALTAAAEGFTDTNVPACTTPKTTSSMVSSEGELLSTTPEGAIERSDPDPSLAFGCQ